MKPNLTLGGGKRFSFGKIAAATVLTTLIAAIGLYFFCAYLLPLPEKITFATRQTTKLFDRNGVLLHEILLEDSGKKKLVTAEEIPLLTKNAFIAAEDKNFYRHGGIDWISSFRALSQNADAGRVVSGGSTITQQLARNLIGTEKERSWSNKLREAAYAVRLETVYSKAEILEKYLNTVYFGNLAYGIESAARDYFGKSLTQLDLAETALLAGLPKAPSRYNPFRNLAGAEKRQEYVLEQMAAAGFITEEEAAAAKVEKLVFRWNKSDIRAPHFVYFVIGELEEKWGVRDLREAGWQITTTLDLPKQEAIEKIITAKLEPLRAKKVGSAAVLTVDLQKNTILTYAGSGDYFDTRNAGAVDIIQAQRQPGSALKPFTYLLALLRGRTLATIYQDVPTQFPTAEGPYTPRNYDLAYHGPVRMRAALANSYNIPAVKALQESGIANFGAFLSDLGISSLLEGADHYGLSLTLGGGEVKMYELAQAYSILARGGEKKDFEFIEKITDNLGKTIYERPPATKSKNAFDDLAEQQAYLITHVLSDNQARLPAFGTDNVLEIGRPAAVKTGTTRNFKDNWTFGFTPQILTAVWVGNADARPMENISGVDGAGPIWKATMDFLHKNEPIESFGRPSGLTEREICAASGKLKTPFCPQSLVELFIAGTEPQEADDIYRPLTVIQAINGDWRLWRRECGGQPQEKVYAFYPAESRQWAFENGIAQPPDRDCLGFKSAPEAGTPTKDGAGQFSDADFFAIANPRAGDRYTLEATLPDRFEAIPFKVNWGSTPWEVCYVLNQENLPCVQTTPFEFLWIPRRGRHELTAKITRADGSTVITDKTVFEVR